MSNYELLIPYSIRLLLLVNIILCNIYATLHDFYLRINYSNYVSNMFEVGQAGTTSTFRSEVICVKL